MSARSNGLADVERHLWIAALAAVPVALLFYVGLAMLLSLSITSSVRTAEEASRLAEELPAASPDSDVDTGAIEATSDMGGGYPVASDASGCADLPDMPPPGEPTDSPEEILEQWTAVSNLAFGRADVRYLSCLYAITDGVLYQHRVEYIQSNGPTPRALEYKDPYAAVEVDDAIVVMCFQPYFQGQPEGEVEQAKFELHNGYWALVATYECSA